METEGTPKRKAAWWETWAWALIFVIGIIASCLFMAAYGNITRGSRQTAAPATTSGSARLAAAISDDCVDQGPIETSEHHCERSNGAWDYGTYWWGARERPSRVMLLYAFGPGAPAHAERSVWFQALYVLRRLNVEFPSEVARALDEPGRTRPETFDANGFRVSVNTTIEPDLYSLTLNIVDTQAN